jgi:hypothetical protein
MGWFNVNYKTKDWFYCRSRAPSWMKYVVSGFDRRGGVWGDVTFRYTCCKYGRDKYVRATRKRYELEAKKQEESNK